MCRFNVQQHGFFETNDKKVLKSLADDRHHPFKHLFDS